MCVQYSWKTEEGMGTSGAVVSCLTWVLGTELRSFGGAVSALIS